MYDPVTISAQCIVVTMLLMQCGSIHQVLDLGNHRKQDIWTILVLKKQEFAVWTETEVQER